LLSLAALVGGDSPKPAYLLELEDCLMGVNRTKEEVDNGTKSLFTDEVVVGFDEVKSCALSFDGMKNFAVKVGGGNRHKDALVTNLDEVAFQMIGDDYNDTKAQLDSVRARRTKFICINDNMEDPSQEVIDLFQDFLESFFPKPSSFELTDGRINKYLRLEEVEEVRAKVKLVWNCCLVGIVLMVAVAVAVAVGVRAKGQGVGEGRGRKKRRKAKEN
jgi:UDP-N-acetylglucosamine-lysosomal-enzyme